jgi:hypothetical protein
MSIATVVVLDAFFCLAKTIIVGITAPAIIKVAAVMEKTIHIDLFFPIVAFLK